jgi:RNA polymerase sigma-70 factor (ECF subfamily)
LQTVGQLNRIGGCNLFEILPDNKMQPGTRFPCPTKWRRCNLALNADSAMSGSSAATSAALDLADVDRVLGGDVNAFEGIVRRWQGPLVNMAWRYCRDRQRAEELAQEALVKCWRGLKGWRREGSFSTWMFGVAANVFRSDLKRFPTETVAVEDGPEPGEAAGQLEVLVEKDRSETVRRAVLALPLRYREAVVLFYFHERDVAATAKTMGMPEGSVKARLSRARELLRKRFPQLGGESGSQNLRSDANTREV